MYRRLLELFSVQLPEFEEHHAHEKMHGCILIVSRVSYFVLDGIKIEALLNIDDKGYVKLRGPNRVIDASGYVRFDTHFFTYPPLADGYIENDMFMMWDNDGEKCFDMLLTRVLKTHFGQVAVNYAVYNDSVEAWVDVRVLACQFPTPAFYGTITTRNSYLLEKEVTSVLFTRKREEGICLGVASDSDKGKHHNLPLSRCKTVHPYGSVVTVSLNIMQCGDTEAQDQSISSEPDLHFTTCLSGQQVRTTGNGVSQIEVTVNWHEKLEPVEKDVFVI